LIAGQLNPGKSEVVGLAGNPDQAYGAELAERGYPHHAPLTVSNRAISRYMGGGFVGVGMWQ
jgi:hypothetical protein